MDAIGGYFELAEIEEGVFPHTDGILLNTGRNALEYILRAIGGIQRIYLPRLTCQAVLEPLRKLHIPWSFYPVNADLEIADDLSPEEGEFIIANNYFGIKDTYIKQLAGKYGHHLIVDCAQALLADPIHGIKSFYSPRKFVGVADGGIAYLDDGCTTPVHISGTDCSNSHNSHLYTRKRSGAEAGFKEFQENEIRLENQPILQMSDSTRVALNHIDYTSVAKTRKANFSYLHAHLSSINLLSASLDDGEGTPMVYPLLLHNGEKLRQILIDQRIFVARYWPDVLTRCPNDSIEAFFANNLVALPVDQRYGIKEMDLILHVIESAPSAS